MKNFTTYQARRTNLFVWLTALLMLASAVARIIFYSSIGASGIMMAVRSVLPAIVCIYLAIRLPIRGEKYFYVTVKPVVLFTVYFIFALTDKNNIPVLITICCIALILLQGFLYCMTFSGRISNKYPVLLVYLAFAGISASDSLFRQLFILYFQHYRAFLLSDVLLYLGIIAMILSAKKLPAPAPGEARRARFGDRMDGYRVRGVQPMTRIIPYIMVTRNTASNFIHDSVDIGAAERYVRQKRRDGYKHFGIAHVVMAAWLRSVADYPALNRFVAGQEIYHRNRLQLNMIVKKEMAANGDDTAIKLELDPSFTAVQLYEKMDEKVQAVKSTPLDSGFDKLAALLSYIPGFLLSVVVWLLRSLDYVGLLPPELLQLSPFHGSVFFTSMGSLGIPPIFHHLYDFGNVPMFCSFGAKRSEKVINDQGEIITKKYLDYTWVTDERIVDGFYYAAVLKRMRYLIAHPDNLDEPPEEVKQDID